jgi:hypothetical protein
MIIRINVLFYPLLSAMSGVFWEWAGAAAAMGQIRSLNLQRIREIQNPPIGKSDESQSGTWQETPNPDLALYPGFPILI